MKNFMDHLVIFMSKPHAYAILIGLMVLVGQLWDGSKDREKYQARVIMLLIAVLICVV